MLVDHEIIANETSPSPPGVEEWQHLEGLSWESSSPDGDSGLEPLWQLVSPASSIADSACFDASSPFPDTDTRWLSPTDSPLLLAWPSQFSSAKRTAESNFLATDTCDSQDNWSIVHFDFTEPGVGGMMRTFSLEPSESASSDDVPELWPADFWQCGFTHSNSVPATHTCPICFVTFSRASDIEDHAKETKHKPFACSVCNRLFSRQDALTRHREIHESQKRYPCAICEKCRGPVAFRRRDHLRQHLRKKHRVHPNAEFPRYCPYDRCNFSAREGRFDGFRLRRDYLKHMRESHGEEKHDCDVDGCDRKGRRGFARLNDLDKHRQLIHKKLESGCGKRG